jgi:hypothetical protein
LSINGQLCHAPPGNFSRAPGKAFAAVASLCGLISVAGQDALSGPAKVRVQLAFPYWFSGFLLLLLFLLLLQNEKHQAFVSEQEREKEQE